MENAQNWRAGIRTGLGCMSNGEPKIGKAFELQHGFVCSHRGQERRGVDSQERNQVRETQDRPSWRIRRSGRTKLRDDPSVGEGVKEERHQDIVVCAV